MKIIRLTESDIHSIVNETVKQYLKETDCAGAMQGGGDNPSAGQIEVPFGADDETSKRSNNFKNGSMMMRRATYKPKTQQ